MMGKVKILLGILLMSGIIALLWAISEKAIYPIALFIYFLTAPLLYWAFGQDKDIFSSRKTKRVIFTLVVLYTIISLFSIPEGGGLHQFGFIAFPLLYAIIFREQLRSVLKPREDRWPLIYTTIFILLWIEEGMLAIDHVIGGIYSGLDSILLHLLGYSGFYFGVTLTMLFFYRRFNFSLRQTFIIGGIWGLVVEQEHLGLKILFSGNILDFIIFASFILPVYGLFLTGPRLLFGEEFNEIKNTNKWQAIVLFLAIFIIPLITWYFSGLIYSALGINFNGVV